MFRPRMQPKHRKRAAHQSTVFVVAREGLLKGGRGSITLEYGYKAPTVNGSPPVAFSPSRPRIFHRCVHREWCVVVGSSAMLVGGVPRTSGGYSPSAPIIDVLEQQIQRLRKTAQRRRREPQVAKQPRGVPTERLPRKRSREAGQAMRKMLHPACRKRKQDLSRPAHWMILNVQLV